MQRSLQNLNGINLNLNVGVSCRWVGQNMQLFTYNSLSQKQYKTYA